MSLEISRSDLGSSSRLLELEQLIFVGAIGWRSDFLLQVQRLFLFVLPVCFT
jgi:hypothetical protein